MMRASLFSPSWYRVAELKPRLRSHAEIHRHDYRGEPWYVLQDHTSGRFMRFTPGAYLLVGLMDGERTVQEIWEIGRARLGDDAPTQEEMIRILSQLHGVDVLLCDVTPDTLELLRRYEKKRLVQWTQNIRSPLALRFRLFDPEKFLVRYQEVVKPFFSGFGAIAWLVVVGWAISLVGLHWTELTENVTDRVLVPGNLILIWIIFPILKAFHEFGHAFAIKRLGGEVHEMGIIFLVFTPIPYVDASSSSAFRNKWERAFVGAAGIAVELFIAAIAMFVWVNVEAGPVRAVAYNIVLIAGVSSLLFNLNPLLRYDGYYILADFIEIPNLGPRGMLYLKYLAQRYLFGVHDAEPPFSTSGERVWFVLYSVAAFFYRIFIYVVIILFIADKFFFVGILIALWAVASMFFLPLFKAVKFLLSSPRLGRKRPRAIAVSLAIVVIAMAVIFLMPVPLSTRTEGVMWVPEESFVRAGAEGVIDRIVTKPGTEVSPGDLLIQCSDPLLPARIRVLESKYAELLALYDSQILLDRLKAQITAEQISHVTNQLQDAREKASELAVYSQAKGIFLVSFPQDLPGKFVRRGEVLGYVVEPSMVTIRVVVSPPDADLVRERTRMVQIRLPEKLSEIAMASIKREVPAATDQLPAKALGQAGGGVVAIDPRDEKGLKSFQKIFLFDIEPPSNIWVFNVGGRVYVRFDHGYEPLVWRWYRDIRQLLLTSFNV
jgi:putative peptide zinc metalloprotease protein